MEVSLVKPQGFCSGVLKAVAIAKKAREEHPDKNVYILGMLAHNKTLTDDLTKQGLITLNDEDEFGAVEKLFKGDVLIFTAHGHGEEIEKKAKEYAKKDPRIKLIISSMVNPMSSISCLKLTIFSFAIFPFICFPP